MLRNADLSRESLENRRREPRVAAGILKVELYQVLLV
jgi:hypothetical protein